ncbi:hypothetical protein LJR225_003605 [Phenylobacterium sp. LjRoot225]|uniref:hypothetical protein n=1 Tax=Phenylobacterium sp. LjRoot225 TaxID=3342285 RepID=UPI003ECF6868
MPVLRHTRGARTLSLKLAVRAGLAAGVAFAGLNAQAGELAGVAAAFGNTVVSTYPDGTSQKIWLRADGSWTGLSRRNSPLAGSWAVKGAKVCLRQSQPPTLPVAYCTSLPASSQPGVQWTGRDVAGRAITLSLTKGMPAQYQSAQSQRGSSSPR